MTQPPNGGKKNTHEKGEQDQEPRHGQQQEEQSKLPLVGIEEVGER